MPIETALLERRRQILIRKQLDRMIPGLPEALIAASLWNAKNLPEAIANLLRLTGLEAAFLRDARILLAAKLEELGGEANLREARELREMDGSLGRANRAGGPVRPALRIVQAPDNRASAKEIKKALDSPLKPKT